jgi:long-chain acyl-CoA synthetase
MITAAGPHTIPEALADAAIRLGARQAYQDASRSISWRELHAEAGEAAAGLVALGLGQGERVAICAENSIDWILAYHAVALAGAAAVLVYYELRPGEIAEQVSRPGCRFLVASESVLARLPDALAGVEQVIVAGPERSAGAGRLTLAGLAARATAASREALPGRAPAPDDLAAIIYTSGTTGGAKGVMLSQRNFVANATAVAEAIHFTADDRVLLVLPLHHAMPFVAAIVLAVLVGASFVIENDLRRIRDRLQEQKPTIFFGVPALYELMHRNLLARAEADGRLQKLQAWQRRLALVKRVTGVNLAPLLFRPVHKALGGRLRFLFSGGAALNPRLVHEFAALGLPLLQGWGMTEASPAICVQRFSKARFLLTRYYERHAGSVGSPLPGVEVRLIDVPEKDIRVATSDEGEVIIRGDNVFMGYWQAGDATAEVKVDGWLRTGDLGRIDGDGCVYLTGRSKYVIVLESGEKVHPDELETKLSESALLQDVCVLARPGREGKTQVAVVACPDLEAARRRAEEAGAALDEAALRRFVAEDVDRLGRDLAAYKRITRIELSDTPLPKTPLRKVARGRMAAEHSFDFATWRATAEAATPAASATA